MKKILTVSLFAIMAVSAANAEIASTRYVTDRTGDTQTLNKIGANEAKPASLTEGVNQLNVYITDQLAEVENGAGAMVDGVANELAAYKTANDAAVEAAQTAADKAQGEVDALEGVVSKQNTDLTAAIATAKSEAITAAADDAKKYIDEDELTASQNAQNTTLQTYADNKASAAQTAAEKTAADELAAAKTELEGKITNASSGASTALSEALQNYTTTTDMTNAIATAKSQAIADAKTAGDAAYAVKSTETVASGNTTAIQTINTNMGPLAGVTIPEACATGRCALVMENNQAKWETINY